jgi:hypothetical protein
VHVSIHNRLHPPIDSVPADSNRVDCPIPEGRGYRKCAPGLAGSQAEISLKGEVSDHKGNFDQQSLCQNTIFVDIHPGKIPLGLHIQGRCRGNLENLSLA